MLTEQRKRFVHEFIGLQCRKRSQAQAAINAGYSPKSASQQASDLLKIPEVREYLEKQKSLLESDLRQRFIFEASEAYDVLVDIMKDEDAKDSDRITAAKDLLDRAGFKPKDKVEVSGLAAEQSKLDALIEQMRGRSA